MGRTISTRNGIGLSKVKQLSTLVRIDLYPESLTVTKQALEEINRCIIFRSTDVYYLGQHVYDI